MSTRNCTGCDGLTTNRAARHARCYNESMGTDNINFVYFDIETERSADEVGGWQNIEHLGIAVAVTCASRDDQAGEGAGAGTSGWQFTVFPKPEDARPRTALE